MKLEANILQDGIALLGVDFHDGKNPDAFLLESFNPFSQLKGENGSEMDICIFRGYLRDEPTVFATLTGGCPFEDSFEVRLI